MMRTIVQADPLPGYKVNLVYSDGETVIADFEPLIAMGGVYSALADPDYFAQVSVGERGRFIQWPGELDFCADALWLDAHSSDSSAA
jgi:hypothetical protein